MESAESIDLVLTGVNGHFELIPKLTTEDDKVDDISDSNTFPRITLPVGAPPILPSLESELEQLLANPGKLPIHHVVSNPTNLRRDHDFLSLLHTEVCPSQTDIAVERHPTTGKVLDIKENFVADTGQTSKNSLSLNRSIDKTNIKAMTDLRGSNINLPFWPGGMEDEILFSDTSANATEQNDVNFDDDKLYLTVAPGFSCGKDFSSEGERATSEEPAGTREVVSVADIMAGVEEIELMDSDDDDQATEHEKPDESTETETLARSESLEELVKNSTSEEKREAEKKAAPVKKEEWAVMLDISQPVKDFHRRIPNMAYKWPFELDTFQKQAVLKLENHQSVFVAAHTSAGKTVVAEYAIALSLKHMTRTIYTSPIKALSNQKFRDFKQTFGDVGLVTGDVQLNQTASCLIMTTEILRSMLYNGSDVIRDLEWVIFDEVHYINDSERGVVWEEVLIMLPEHVNVIMLSATVPNTLEFADWVGRTKRKKMYVVSTAKRPVPLEHFLYTGNSTKTCSELFLLLDAKGAFLTTGYSKALEAKKERASKSSQSFGAKGQRQGNPSQDKNTWLSVIEMLKRKDKLPAVAFIFSKKKIEETSACLSSVDLTTAAEKSDIHLFFHKCVLRLKGTDRVLPQVVQVEELLKRGLGVHHSGVLPILKEIVEMLFQRGLVKILFATETFAMGVNMPARTVIFDTIRKHDGLNFRNLLTGEYIQMAGRAGRRGLDSTGTVVLLCKGDVPEMSELHKMMLGKPTKLESQFRLTYTMLLNLLRVEQLRVQDMIKRSFSEFHHQKECTNHRQSLHELRRKMADVTNIECYLCSLDLEAYHKHCSEYRKLEQHIQHVVFTHPTAVKSMSPGRVVMVKCPLGQSVLGVVLSNSLSSNNQRKFTVLVIAEKEEKNTQEKQVTFTGLEPILPCSLFLPEGACWHRVVELTGQDITRITTKTIKVDANSIIKNCERREIPRFSDEPPERCVTQASQELLRLTEASPSGLSGLHPVNDLKLRDIELVEQCRTLQFMENDLVNFNCTRCQMFLEHFATHDSNMQLKEEFKRLQFLLSDESLELLPEYTQRLEVLKRLKYVSNDGTVQLKGRVACEMSNHELMITELVFENVLTDLHPADIAALLSCFVFEMKRCSEPQLTDTLTKGKEQILQQAEVIGVLQKEVGMLMPVADYKEQFHFGLMEVVFEWARGMPFSDITTLTDVQEGIIVRSIQRLHELLSDVRNAARLIGDRILAQKMEDAMEMVKRDIVFAASLYTQ